MKRNTVFHVLAIVMSLLVFGMPQMVIAQDTTDMQSEIQQATADARRDAKQNTSPLAWGAGGFACGCFAPLYAYITTPQVPVGTLLGKTPTYVSTYTQVYQENAKRQRIQAAVIGCAIGSAVSTAYYYIAIFPQLELN